MTVSALTQLFRSLKGAHRLGVTIGMRVGAYEELQGTIFAIQRTQRFVNPFLLTSLLGVVLLSSMTVVQLKAHLLEHGQPAWGLKAVLLARAEKYEVKTNPKSVA
jgi:hypothetical protein